MSDNSYHEPESIVKEIKRKTRRKFSAEEKINQQKTVGITGKCILI